MTASIQDGHVTLQATLSRRPRQLYSSIADGYHLITSPFPVNLSRRRASFDQNRNNPRRSLWYCEIDVLSGHSRLLAKSFRTPLDNLLDVPVCWNLCCWAMCLCAGGQNSMLQTISYTSSYLIDACTRPSLRLRDALAAEVAEKGATLSSGWEVGLDSIPSLSPGYTPRAQGIVRG